ncbi:MAG: hypothetical protein ACKO11_11155 [Cuspidothrix sp.]
MSVNKKAAIAFKEVLKNSSNLLTNEDWQQLEKLFQELPDDDDKVTEKIEYWLTSHPLILQVYEQNLKNTDSSINKDGNLGAGGTKSSTPANQQSESSQQLIQNAIKENSPLSKNSTSKKS